MIARASVADGLAFGEAVGFKAYRLKRNLGVDSQSSEVRSAEGRPAALPMAVWL